MWMSTVMYLDNNTSEKNLDALDTILSGEPIPVELSVNFSTGQMLLFAGVLIGSIVLGIAIGTAVSRGI